MGLLRTYFSKDNVIIRNSYANTGRNPIVELFHGGSLNPDELKYYRYIFDLELDQILEKLSTKEIGSIEKTKHFLKIMEVCKGN